MEVSPRWGAEGADGAEGAVIIQYIFFRNIQFKKLFNNFFPEKFNSKIDSKI